VGISEANDTLKNNITFAWIFETVLGEQSIFLVL
jgi:hypothetical protein